MGRGPPPGLTVSGSCPRWVRAVSALTVGAVLGVSGCGLPAAPPAPAPTASRPAAASAQNLLDRLVTAARSRNRPAFDAEISIRDPSFDERSRLLFSNIAGLPWETLQLRLQGGPTPLPDRLRNLLGPDAWRQPTTVRWRLAGETAWAEHTVWLTFAVHDGTPRLAGTEPPRDADAPADVAPQPVWWTGPVTSASRAGVTVLVGSGQPAATWLDRATAAATEVRERVHAGAAARWSGDLVVEVPAGRRAFEAVLGAEPGSYAAIAAVTLPEGPSADAALRVVVNPEVTRTLAPLGVAVVLTHETVHVATRSPDSPAPTWLVEGLADDIALTAHPDAATGVAEPLLERVRAAGPPPELPADEEFLAGADDLAVSYATAWLVCRYVRRTYSTEALQRLYAGLDAGRGLDETLTEELGVDLAGFTAGWRNYLVQQAGG
nr:hypothetical protein [uncultured Friedmanniella sp.]